MQKEYNLDNRLACATSLYDVPVGNEGGGMAVQQEEDYLTVDEACELLNVKRATLYSYVSRGLLQSYKQGIRRQRLYRRSEIESLLAIRPGDAEPEPEPESEPNASSGLPRADEWVGER